MHNRLRKDTANRLRGLVANTKESAFRETINNLRKSMSPTEARIVYTILETHPLFSKRPHTDKFPKQPVTSAGVVRLADVSLSHELSAQIARLNSEKSKLCDFIQKFGNANRLAEAGHSNEALGAYIQVIAEFGYSNWLLRKFVFLNNRTRDGGSIASTIETYFSAHSGNRMNPITMALYDMMDDTVSYWGMRRSFSAVFGKQKISQTSEDIVKFFFYPHNAQAGVLSSTIQSFSLLSLADTLFIVCFYAFNSPVGSEFGITEIVEQYLDPEIIELWSETFGKISTLNLIEVSRDEPEHDDFRFYRRSCAWLEYGNIASKRFVFDYYSSMRSQELFRPSLHATERLNEFFAEPFDMKLLASPYTSTSVEQTTFHHASAGMFARSIALLHLARLGNTFADLRSQQLLKLLNQTRDIAMFLDPDAISALFYEYPHDRMSKYLELILKHDSQPSNIGEHAVRRVVQDLIIEDYDSDIVKLADSFNDQGQHLAEHFLSTCTENFLVQLYQLYHQAKDVVEAKASLLEWYGKKFDDRVTTERAHSLRLDLKLQDIRGDFNENRIYVDPVRFGQWVEDKLIDDLREACRIALVVPQVITTNEEIADPLKVRQDVSLRLASVILRAFTEFCTNKFYGIDSYIGRRIRHGTLRGYMVSEVNAFIDAPEFTDLRSVAAFRDATDQWLERYASAIDHFGLERLHVKSRSKPSGAIMAEIASIDKRNTTQAALTDLTEKYRADASISSIAKVLIDYSWLLVEKDLENLRAYVDRMRADVGVINPSDLTPLLDTSKHPLARDFCHRLNAITLQKFKDATRWFSKPSNAIPSAPISLLFDAVVREIMEQEPKFRPKIVRSGDTTVIFMGSRYHYVYDVLEVLVANVAEHGVSDGDLIFDIVTVDIKRERKIVLTLTSLVKPGEIEFVRAQLQQAMEADIDNAMVEEGFSGIRKVRKLAQEVDEITDIEAVVHHDDRVTFRATFTTAIG